MGFGLGSRSGQATPGATAPAPAPAPAPGKKTLTGGMFAPAQRAARAAAGTVDLPLNLRTLLDAGDIEAIADRLRLYKPGEGVLDSAFEYLRLTRGPTFVEQLSWKVFPREELQVHDWLGLGEYLDEKYSDGDPTNDRIHLNSLEGCLPSEDVEPETLGAEGVQFYLRTSQAILNNTDTEHPPGRIGPTDAGPYEIRAHTLKGRLVFFTAKHKERGEKEWVIGPESIDRFVLSVELYAGAAMTQLPGAEGVPNSQKDGALTAETPPSLIEQEAHGDAPWQQAWDLAGDMAGPTQGGTALVASMNGALRLRYAHNAHQFAERLYSQVNDGKLGHLDGRSLAVEFRNEEMLRTRRDGSPANAEMSRAIKSDKGISVAEMERRKTRELFNRYRGMDKHGKPLSPEEALKWREILDNDSKLWGQWAAAIDAGGDDALLHQGMRSLGKRPEVSKAIIKSAGRPNGLITGLAAVNLVGGAVGAGLGIYDAITDIRDAEEAYRLHVAARAWAGFAGGIIGAEGAVWIASAIIASAGGAGAGVMLVVSILAGTAGGMIGSQTGVNLVDLIAQFGEAGLGAAGAPGTAFGAAGGMSGLYTRGAPQGRNLGREVANTIFEMDAQIRRLDAAIPGARSREDLQAAQTRRLELLERRYELEDLYTAIRIGVYEANESRLPDEEPPSDTMESIPEPPPKEDSCLAVDDDCDSAVD